MPHAAVNGTRIHYELRGEAGPVLVFAHGGAADATQWDAQVAEFASGYRVLAYDSRGHGRSDVPEEGYALEVLTEDLHALLEHLGLERACVVGLSMGGMVAMSLALARPEKVAALVLVSTAGEVDATMARNFEESARVAEEVGMEAFAEGFCNVIFTESFRCEHPERVESIRRRIAATSPQGYARTIRALARQRRRLSDLAAIRVPTLVVAGERESALNSMERARAIHRSIAGSELVAIDGAGYLPGVERPEEFNRVVADFLVRHGLGPRGR